MKLGARIKCDVISLKAFMKGNVDMLITEKYLKRPFNNRESVNFLLFSSADFISQMGTAAYSFAMGLYVLKITGSGLSFALNLAFSIISTIIVIPFAGVLADRLDKKLISVIMDLMNGALLIELYLITMNINLNVPMIYISTFIINLLTSIYSISVEAAKPNLVSETRLLFLNSVNKILESSSSILGPMAGGIVFAFLDIRFFIIINGISFMISGFLELFIDFKYNLSNKRAEKEKVDFVKDIMGGINYIKDKKYILDSFGVFIVLNFFIGLSINIPMPYIINNVLKLNSEYFGIIESAIPAGMILGAVMIKLTMEKYQYQKIIKSACVILSACMAAVGIPVILHYCISGQTVYLIYYIIVMIFTGTAISLIDIPVFNMLQRTIPDEFRGRVLSIGISTAKIVLPAALILAGALINTTPSYILPILGGIFLFIYSMLYIRIN